MAGRGVASTGGLGGAVVLDMRDLVVIGTWGRGGRRQGGSMFRGRSSENRQKKRQHRDRVVTAGRRFGGLGVGVGDWREEEDDTLNSDRPI
jgi:hypothetical protein